MYKGTTPTIIFTFTDFDPTTADEIILTMSADRKNPLIEIEKADMSVDGTSISVWLSQEETLAFPVGNVYCQFNFVFEDGQRVASNIGTIVWNRNLHSEVIS